MAIRSYGKAVPCYERLANKYGSAFEKKLFACMLCDFHEMNKNTKLTVEKCCLPDAFFDKNSSHKRKTEHSGYSESDSKNKKERPDNNINLKK